MNRIKVVSEVAELVPILRAVDSDVKAEVFREVSAGWMTVREIEAKFGEEGANAIRFFEKMKLVETKWQTGPTASPEKAYHAFYSSFHINATAPIQEISDVLHAAMMSEETYAAIEERIFDMVGTEGKFSGDVADTLKVTQTKLKALVKRSPGARAGPFTVVDSAAAVAAGRTNRAAKASQPRHRTISNFRGRD